MLSRVFAAFAAIVVLAGISTPSAQARDWYRAESAHFILYSEDTERNTLEFVQDLERLDEVLRLLTGMGPDDGSLPPSNKVTVFRFGETADMAALAVGNRNSGIGGFFIGRAIGSVAFVPRRQNQFRGRSRQEEIDSDVLLDPRGVLFHEYVHYFMFQHRDAPYPLWYSEGFAELFSNLEFEEDRFIIGDVPTWRSISLATIPIDLEETFDPTPGGDRYTTGRTYAHGWLIASHLNLNPDRRGQMGDYMVAINQGMEPMEAAEAAFGDLDVLEDELEEFRQGRARILRVPYAVEEDPAVEIRRLEPDEEARMILMMRNNLVFEDEDAQELVNDARRLAERYPDSVPALIEASRALLAARIYEEADALAIHALELDADNTTAAILRGEIALRQSFADPTQLEVARDRFADANQMENDHAYPLYGYYLSFLFEEDRDEIPDIAKAALEGSFGYAPFDDSVRQALIHMLLEEGRVPEARVVGARYLIGSGRRACLLRKQFDEFEAGETAPLLESFRPDHPGEYLDEDAREAEQEEFDALIEAYDCEPD